ncbi:MAG: YjbQ family protein [Bdellovibrionales bacterium]|nr:YjbQ family protein [Bdellovibrionales bacterium]
MKAYTDYLYFTTSERKCLVNITDDLQACVQKAHVKDGLCLVSAMHITAGIWVNDEESGLKKDVMAWLEALAPVKEHYLHHRTGEDNADAHLRVLKGAYLLLEPGVPKVDRHLLEPVSYDTDRLRRDRNPLARSEW